MNKGLVLVFHREYNASLFEQIIIALKKWYTLVSLQELGELLIAKRSLKNICHITFDDGENSFYTTVFPILKKHQVPVSLFVSPRIAVSCSNFWFQEVQGYDEKILKAILSGELGIPVKQFEDFSSRSIFKCLPFHQIKKVIEIYQQQTQCGKKPPQNMNLEHLKKVEASGLVTIGAHTLNHPILKNEDDAGCSHEISASIKELEAMLGHPVTCFAYPNGRVDTDFGEREMHYLKENKITLAFSTEVDNITTKTNLLSIPRMGFARMGLAPSNPLIVFRLNSGKRWIDVRSIGKPSEKQIRERITALLNP